MSNPTSMYTTYMVKGLPAGVFGEAYVVVAGAEVMPATYRAEYCILMQKPVESMNVGGFDIATATFPPELGPIDAEFVCEESLRQAEIHLLELLETRAAELGRPEVAHLHFELKECTTPLLGCWMRGRFTKQLIELNGKVQCQPLRTYLTAVQQVQIIRRSAQE